jgi:tRNA dimethylallyltransferase
MHRSPTKYVAIMGATATGKSALGIRLAERFRGEVVSMDSRQVYRRMDIGTGKVSPKDRARVPHHLLDILDPGEAGSAGRHAELARRSMEEITARGNVPFLVGGTGLYFDAVFRPLIDIHIPRETLESIRAGFQSRDTLELYAELRRVDPDRARYLSPNDRVRITRALEIFLASGSTASEHLARQAERSAAEGKAGVLKLVLTMPRQRLRRRIAQRTRAMYEAGWVDEVKRLVADGYGLDSPGMRSLGYAEIARALIEGTDPGATMDEVIVRTQQYAKRQETYFRKDDEAIWLDASSPDYQAKTARMVAALLGVEAEL